MSDGADGFALFVFARRIESAGVGRTERPRPMVDPDVVVRVDRQAADITDDPVVRQWLRPAGVGNKAGCRSACGRFWRSAFHLPFERLCFYQRVNAGTAAVGCGGGGLLRRRSTRRGEECERAG